jgi:hypothetical protein
MLPIFGGSSARFETSIVFGYAAALCSTVAEFWRPDCAQHSLCGDPGVWSTWPSENQYCRETGAE